MGVLYKTENLAWDASADAMKTALLALPSVDDVIVTRIHKHEASPFVYAITFSKFVGDMPPLVANYASLTGTTPTVQVVETAKGISAHIDTHRRPIRNEVQQVRLVELSTPASLPSGTFQLQFRGHTTVPLAVTATPTQVKTALEDLEVVGQVAVTASSDASAYYFNVEFIPQGTLINMPTISISQIVTDSLSVATVTHADTTTIKLAAGDTVEITSFVNNAWANGIWTVIGSPTRTTFQFSAVEGGRISPGVSSTYTEAGSANQNLQGHNLVTAEELFGNMPSMTVIKTGLTGTHATAVVSTTTQGLTPFEAYHTYTSVDPTKSTAFDSKPARHHSGLSTGVYQNITYFTIQARDRFSNTITEGPIKEVQILTILADGGTFKLGFMDGTGVGTQTGAISYQATVSQFESALEALPFAGNATAVRTSILNGYEYKITFEAKQGDISGLTVDDSLLTSSSVTASGTITNCDWYYKQTITTAAETGSTVMAGTFYVTYNGARTTDLAADISATDLKTALELLPTIYTVIVSRSVADAVGGYSWVVSLVAVDGARSKLFAESHLLTGTKPTTTVDFTCDGNSKAGRVGENFVVTLTGQEASSVLGQVNTILGDAKYIETSDTGLYEVSYISPAVGTYKMDVGMAKRGGLSGSYFTNRWLYGSATETRVDKVIDFDFKDSFITATGKDYISARWIGYIQVPYNETFTFYTQANDGAKLFINDILIIDKFDSMVNTTTPGVVNATSSRSEYFEYSGTTSTPLMAGRLYSIKLEYRENTGNAQIRFMWSSPSQKKVVVPTSRLFFKSTPIVDSPFTVNPVGIIPTTTINEAVTVASSTSLQIEFDTPINTGGESVTKYKIEWYDTWGTTPVQTIVVANATGGTFIIRYNNELTVPLPYNIDSWKLEYELERLPSIRDVKITTNHTGADNVNHVSDHVSIFMVEFLAYPGALPHNLEIYDMAALQPAYSVAGICFNPAGGLAVPVTKGIYCPTGTNIVARTGTAPSLYQSAELSFASFGVNVHDKHKWNITGLTAGQMYNVRVSAYNSLGYSVPSTPVKEMPRDVPDAPYSASVLLVASSSTSLKTYWVIPPQDNGALTTHYKVQWDTTPYFNSSNLKQYESTKEAFDSHLLASGNYEYVMTGLTKGTKYWVQIMAKNTEGYSVPRPTTPLFEIPRRQPDEIVYGGVTVATLPADGTATVTDSSSNLLVSWEKSSDFQGDEVTAYKLEWWDAVGSHEVQKIKLSASSAITGTFTVTFNGETTDHLLWNIDATGMTAALDTLTTIQHVEVERSAIISNGYEWTVTFLGDTGNLPDQLIINKIGLSASGSASNVIELASTVSHGTNYGNHGTYVLDPKNLKPPYRYTITGLSAGVQYWTRVSALNNRGHGRFTSSLPLSIAPPKQKPDLPTATQLAVHSATSLKVIWEAPLSDGGDIITNYKIEWDTLASFKSGADAHPLGSADVIVSANECTPLPCDYIISSLTQGQAYFVRVYAYNSYGFSVKAATTSPTSEIPRTRALPPSVVNVEPSSEESLLVSFDASPNNGGSPVTKYLIEWDAVHEAAVLASASSGTDGILYATNEIQHIDTFSTGNNLGGSFMVRFEGHSTSALAFDISADDMKAALELLPTIGSVAVINYPIDPTHPKNGLRWTVTFLSNPGDVAALEVSTSSGDFFHSVAGGNTLTGTDSAVKVVTSVNGLKGYNQQTVTTACSGGTMSGTFQLTFDGLTSNNIAFNASASSMSGTINGLGNAGKVEVRRAIVNQGHKWTFLFLSRLGPVPGITVDGENLACTNSGSATINAIETNAGVLPALDSSKYGSYELNVTGGALSYNITGLIKGEAYHIRVSAWNGVGNAYGETQYSTPAFSSPSRAPDAPQTSKTDVVSDSEIQMSWTAPLRDGSSPVTGYKVEWDTNSGAREIQIIKLASSNTMSGTFTLNFMGQTTSHLQWDSSDVQVRDALMALNTVGTVKVSKDSQIVSNGFSWTVTFETNIGNQPKIILSTSNIVASGVVGTVTTQVQGSNPNFDAGTVGINVMPLGSATLTIPNEVQQIFASAGSDDLAGSFVVQFMGEVSVPIAFDASADEVVRVLEGLKTIGSVVVTRQLTNQSTTAPVQRHGYSWNVTFVDVLNAGDVPSLLVSTNAGADADTIATGSFNGGASGLTGTSPKVEVFELTKGAIPLTYTISGLSPSGAYFTRVAAINKHGVGPWRISAVSSQPQKNTPSMARSVSVEAESGSRVGVWWQKPMFEGGDPITKYEVQWSTASTFGSLAQVATITPSSDGPYQHTISGLTPGQEYYVRVLPYNALGFGAPATAVVKNNWEEIQRISLFSDLQIVAGQFRLTYQALGSSRTTATPAIAYDASASAVQEAIQALPGITAVEVNRADSGNVFDASGVGTKAFSMDWDVTFLSQTGDVAQLSVDETNTAVETQSLYVYGASASLSAGSYKLKFAGFTTSACIPYSASASDIKTAIDGLDASITVTVTSSSITNPGAGTRYVIQFSPNVAHTGDVPLIEVILPTETAGAACTAFNTPAFVDVRTDIPGFTNDEVHSWVVDTAATAGSYKLSYDSQDTTCFVSSQSASSIATALTALSNTNTVSVTSTPTTGTKSSLPNMEVVTISSTSITQSAGVAISQLYAEMEHTIAITSQGITANAGVTVTQGSTTGTLKTALQNVWTMTTNAQTLTKSAGVAVSQANGYMTWTITTNAVTPTELQGVTVTQSSNSATGTLAVALTGASVTEIKVISAIGQVFDATAPLVIDAAGTPHNNSGK